jgi:hypothetical protein
LHRPRKADIARGNEEELMRRTFGIALVLTLTALALVGCGDFRERAEATEERLVSAEASATQALDAAAENKAEIRELRGRVASLEEELADLRGRTDPEELPTGKKHGATNTE